MRFWLGSDEPSWLWRGLGVDVFVSHRRLARLKTLRRADVDWACDSGAFTQLNTHGRWTTGPEEYADALAYYDERVGRLRWAAAQDLMCEPFVLDRVEQLTGRRPTVAEHQERTVANYLELRALGGPVHVAPVLQGWEVEDYGRCVDLYASAGVDLAALPVVGVGSVCRRESTGQIAAVLGLLASLGLENLHGFGVKTSGLRLYGDLLASSDSMAWSYAGRRRGKMPGCTHRAQTCAHCPRFALEWRRNALASLTGPRQLALI